MQAPQLPGIARSLAKLATPTASIEARGKSDMPAAAPPAASRSQTDARSITAAPHSPTQPIVRRAVAVLPNCRVRRAARSPATNEPMPPKKSGMQPARARWMSVKWGKVSCRKVGIQVM